MLSGCDSSIQVSAVSLQGRGAELCISTRYVTQLDCMNSNFLQVTIDIFMFVVTLDKSSHLGGSHSST